MSEEELWEVRRAFGKRAKELASLDSPHKNPSMGARFRAWRDHPFRQYLDREDHRRSLERERLDPPSYWGPTCGKLQEGEAVEFLTWKHKERFWDTNYDKLILAWRREVGRVLPVLPRAGSLPSNVNVGRSPNNREGLGPSGPAGKAGQGKAPKAPVEKAAGEVPRSLEDREIH